MFLMISIIRIPLTTKYQIDQKAFLMHYKYADHTMSNSYEYKESSYHKDSKKSISNIITSKEDG